MANSILTINLITREALRVLENNLSFTRHVNRQFDEYYGKSGAKIGTTLNIRKPARFQGRNGPTQNIENFAETSVPLTLSNQWGADVQFSSVDLALNLDDFSDRVLKPIMANVANQIDSAGLNLLSQVANFAGVPGTTPNSLSTFLQAGARLNINSAPRDGLRAAVIDPFAEASMVDSLKGLFQSSTEIERQYEEGTMGMAAGFNWSMDQNVQSNTTGAYGSGAITVSGANQTGSTLTITGLPLTQTNALVVGDRFTIAGVFAVNQQSQTNAGSGTNGAKSQFNVLQQFVVTANANSNGSGVATVSIFPAITPASVSVSTQTVSASPANGAAVTINAGAAAGTAYLQNAAFHRDAFCLATADLPLVGGVDMCARASDPRLGISIRIVRQYNITNDVLPVRIDVLGGWTVLRPELGCVVYG